MILKAQIMAEDVRSKDGVEYITLTAMEVSPTPLLQMFDYGLRREETAHKGKLVGKVIEIQVETIRAIFSGRPQFAGRIIKLSVEK